MKVDLFELLEGLFHGVVFFFYNVVDTAWQLVTSPSKAPVALFRRFSRKHSRQTGSLTLLAISFLGIYWLTLPFGFGQRSLLSEISQTLAPAMISSNQWWPLILAALATTAVTDGGLRMWLRIRLPKQRLTRDIVRSTVEYALFLPAAIILAGLIAAVTLISEGISLRPVAISIFVVAIVAIVAAIQPAALLLCAGEKKAGRKSGSAARQSRLVRVWPRHLAMIALVAAAVAVGVNVARAARAAGGVSKTPDVTLTYLRCSLRADQPSIEAVVFNSTELPITIDVDREFSVAIGEGGDLILRAVRQTHPSGAPLVLQPRHAELIKANIIVERSDRKLAGKCVLDGRSTRYGWEGAPATA